MGVVYGLHPSRKLLPLTLGFLECWMSRGWHFVSSFMCRDSEYVTLEYATLEYWLFWIKGIWETASIRRPLLPSFFFLKIGDKSPKWKVSSLYLIIRDREFRPEEALEKNLVTSSLTPQAQSPLSYKFFTNLFFPCVKGV